MTYHSYFFERVILVISLCILVPLAVIIWSGLLDADVGKANQNITMQQPCK